MLEGYITPLLTSYLNKYIKNLRPSDLQLSFWGGDAILRNLELRLDAIEDALRGIVPFELKSGSVKQLSIHIPWTSIGSEPIELTLDSVECTIRLSDLSSETTSRGEEGKRYSTTTSSTLSEPDQFQAPGYISGLMSRIRNNIVVKVTNLLLKIIEDRSDMLLSLSVKEIDFFTANESWKKQFIYTDHFQNEYSICKVCLVAGATVCLDVISGSGQVEVYDEPFVPSCNFECRWKGSYRGNTITGNRFEVLFDEVIFSVSNQQFSLFLHLMDWGIALYYSLKKLKGRDDVEVKEVEEKKIEEKREKSPEPLPAANPTEEGWGNWFMSFVAPEEEPETASTPPISPPSLSLGFYAKRVAVDFKVTQKKPHPVFFSAARNTSWTVMNVEFTGCMAHIDRVPLTKYLGVSVGIMTINGWVGGACPCESVTMAATKHRRTIGSQPVHMYSLGGHRDDVKLSSLLANSFFEEDIPVDLPMLSYWLQHKEEYSAFWFSYDYHDVTDEQEIETCIEKLILGRHQFILTADVFHRIEFYIKKFLSSLEATPLISQGLVVIGDPRAVTNLYITSDPVQICLTTYTHLFDLSHDLTKSESLSSLLVTFEKASVDIAMAMYGGNATLQHPQQLLIEGLIDALAVTGYNWFVSRQTNISKLDRDSFCASTVKLYIHNQNNGTSEVSEYYQLLIPKVDANVDMNQVHLLVGVGLSWFTKTNITSSNISSLDHNVELKLTNISVEYSVSSSEQTFSAFLGQAIAFLSSSSSPTLSFLQSPSPVQYYTKVEYLSKGDRVTDCHMTSNERAFEVCVTSFSKSAVPLIRLVTGSTSVHLCSFLFEFIEECISTLTLFWSHVKKKDHFIDDKNYTIEQHDEDNFNLQQSIITCMQMHNISISSGHILIVFSSAVSTPTKNMTTPTFLLTNPSSAEDILTITLPRLSMESTYAHPVQLDMDSLSWKLSLSDFSLYTVVNSKASYVLHPLSADASVAPIETPAASATGIGIHIDVEVLQLTVAKQQIVLVQELVLRCQKLLHYFVQSDPSLSVIDEVVVNKPQSSSLPSSPHLSLTSFPRPPSDASASVSSFTSPILSLWLQFTLGRLLVGVVSKEAWYSTEAEEILLSFDKQEKGSSCQLKLSSLETTFNGTNSLITKLFSSRSPIVSEAAAKDIEACLRTTYIANQVVLSSPVSKFLLLEVATFSDDARSTEIKLQVQTFEVVLWLPLVTTVVDILSVLPRKETNEDEKLDFAWPHLEVKFCGFQVYFPFNSSTLLINNEGVTVSSHLSFPVSRMVVNSSAMRKLNIAASERRVPSLPGYQLMCYSLQIIGIRKLNHFDSYATCCISTATDFKVIYSPPLYWTTKMPAGVDKLLVSVPVTGHLLELHLDTEAHFLCGFHQIFCIADVMDGIISTLMSTSTSNKQLHQHSHTNLQLLITGKSVCVGITSDVSLPVDQMTKEEWYSSMEGVNITMYNPLLMVMSMEEVTTIDLSAFDLSASYLENKFKSPCHLLETASGSISNDTGLPAGLLSFKCQRNFNEGYEIAVEINRSLRLSISTVFIQLLIKLTIALNEAVTFIYKVMHSIIGPKTSEVSLEPTPVIKGEKQLMNFKCFISTRQVVFQLLSSPVLEPETSKGSGQVALLWEELTVSIPKGFGNGEGSGNVNGEGSGDINGHIFVEGLVIQAGIDDVTRDIVPHTLVECTLSYVLPKFKFDRGTLSLSITDNELSVIVHLNAILPLVQLINEYMDIISMLPFGNSQLENKSNINSNKICFNDDLRRSDLYPVTEDIESLTLPKPGEIRFYCGSPTEPANMTWCYREPRIVSRVNILPVPLGITLGGDYPIDIKVICDLSLYDDVCSAWRVVDTLQLSETSSAVIEPTNIDTPSRKWRLSLTALEWFDEEEDSVLNKSFPLSDLTSSDVLSPLVLAACTCVDSTLSSLLLMSLDVHIRKFDVIVRHDSFGDNKGVISGECNRLKIESDLDDGQLDLFKLSVTDLNGLLQLHYETDFVIELAGLVSVAFLNFSDLVWDMVLFPTQLSTSFTKTSTKQRPGPTSIDMRVSSGSCVTRINPSVMFTAVMATYIIQKHFSPLDNNEKDIIVAPYVICNATGVDLYIGQCNTVEAILLPKNCCIGYNWKSFKVAQKLHICSTVGNTWSDELSVDNKGMNLVSLSTEPEMNFFVDITLNGGVQKIVTFKGNLSIISQLSTPLTIRYHSSQSLESHTHAGFEYESILPSNGMLENLICHDEKFSTLMVKLFNSNDDFTNINVTNDTETSLQLLKISDNFNCWMSLDIDKSFPSLSNIKIAFAPLYEIHNLLPCDIQVLIKSQVFDELHLTVPGKGHTQSLSDIPLNEHHISFTCVPSLDVLHWSEFVTLNSSNFTELVPNNEIICTDNWPYRNCSMEHIFANSIYKQSIKIPTDSERVLNAQLMFSKSKEGSVKMIVVPQVLFINNTMATVVLERKDGHQSTLLDNDIVSLSFDEDLKLIINKGNLPLIHNEFKISQEHNKTLKKLNLINPADPKKVCKLLLHTAVHLNCIIATLKPLFMFTNSTLYPLTLLSCLHNGTVPNFNEISHIDNVVKGDPVPLLIWHKMDGQSLMCSLYLTAAPTRWSLPLSLNYVRRSFSLPVESGNANCVLSTHEEGGIYWAVLSIDFSPRLIFTNSCTDVINVREVGTQGVHSHYQTLFPGSETVFEPPSLAKLYPLIEEGVKDDDSRWIVFKSLSDVRVQLQLVDQSDWSKPIVLSYDTEQCICCDDRKLLFSTCQKSGCLYVSLIPAQSSPVSIVSPSMDANHVLLSFNCSLNGLLVSFDVEDDSIFHSVIQISFDKLHFNARRCMNNLSFNIKVKSIQVDNVFDQFSKYPVVAIPRFDHKPPLKIIESEFPPFLVISFSLGLSQKQFFPEIDIKCQPVTIQIDDNFIQKVKTLFQAYMFPVTSKNDQLHNDTIPFTVLEEADRDSKAVNIVIFNINPIILYLSAHLSQTITISCDDSQITLAPVRLTHVFSNWAELSRSMAAHYTTSALMQADWLIGSLGLIGSPALFLSNLHSGVRDFFSLPYEGITRGPGFFILGLGRGTASLLSGVSGGVLRSLTNFASSVASNMEKLSLDSDHAHYQEGLRRRGQRSSGLVAGVSGLGMSVMSAVAGVVEQPMVSVQQSQLDGAGGYTKSMLRGLGKGLLGVVTKPVGGVFQLVSQAGQGIIDTVGLRYQPQLREKLEPLHKNLQSPSTPSYIRILKEQLRHINEHTIVLLPYMTLGQMLQFTTSDTLFAITKEFLVVLNVEQDTLVICLSLINYQCLQKDDNSLVLRNIKEDSVDCGVDYELELKDDVRTFMSVFKSNQRRTLYPLEFFV